MVLLVAEVEAHDEVVEWLDGLNQSEWHRTPLGTTPRRIR